MTQELGIETFGSRLVDRLYKLKDAKGGRPTRSDMIQLADACLDEELLRRKKNKVAKTDNDAIFEALIKACGLNRDEAVATMGSRIGKARADICAATPDCTPAEVMRRAKCYAAKYRGAALTPSALAGHWSEFAPRDKDKIQEQLDPYVEPANWRDLARKTFYDADIDWSVREWADLAITVRTDILKKNVILPR